MNDSNPSKATYSLTIGHLYPELLNLYGDRGNILCMEQRCRWRGIEAHTVGFRLNDNIDFSQLDIILIGGGSDREQLLVCNRLKEIRQDFAAYVENGGVVLAICGGYQLLGHHYKMGEETIEGLHLIDLTTERGEGRLIGNLIIQSRQFATPLVGFENHGGRTYLGQGLKPLGYVLYGNGNNGKDGGEGVLYKNLVGTYLHGPLLPKNPHLCDYLLSAALRNRYGDSAGELAPLDDTEELAANASIVDRFIK